METSKTEPQSHFASNLQMSSRKWTIRIWMIECATVAGLLAVCKLAPGCSFIAIVLGIVWWLGAFLPQVFNWIGVLLGSATLLPGALFLSARDEQSEIAFGIFVLILASAAVWAAFALLPLLHLEMLYRLGTARAEEEASDEAVVDFDL